MIARFIDYLLDGKSASIDVHEGSTARLLRKASLQHEIEHYCGAGKAVFAGYRRDQRAIAEREQRLNSVRQFKQRSA